jgi:hypothetical protein
MNVNRNQVSFGSTYRLQRKVNIGKANWEKAAQFAKDNGGDGGNSSIRLSVAKEQDNHVEKTLRDWGFKKLQKFADKHSLSKSELIEHFAQIDKR